MSVEICVLGTASGLPASDRFGQTAVLTCGDGGGTGEVSHYLLDVGDGASSLLMRHGFDHRRIRAVFISHMHADHHGGLAQVIKTCMHLGRREELHVLAPGEGIPALAAYLRASYLLDAWLGFPLRWTALADAADRAAALSPTVRLQAYPNDHLAWYRRQAALLDSVPPGLAFESYSAVLKAEDHRIVYSGNLNGPDGADEMAPFVEPCDLLLVELAHVDPVALGRFLGGRDIRRAVVAHFHPRWNGVPDVEIRSLVRQGATGTGLRGEVSLARDGDRFAL